MIADPGCRIGIRDQAIGDPAGSRDHGRSLSFGLLFIPDRRIDEIIRLARLAEESGFRYFWVADEDFYRDVYITLAAVAVNTSRILLGPGCTNPYTRHPAMTALSMATLNELSGGRAVFAIGRGGLNILNPLNIKVERPLKDIEECIEIFRRITGGEEVNYVGETIKISNVRLAFKNVGKIPVYVASMGLKTLRLAGKIADGVLLPSVPPEYVKIALKTIKEGCELSGRNLGEIDIACSVIFSAAESRNKAYQLARPYLVYCLAAMPDNVLEVVNMSREDIAPIMRALPDEGAASKEITDEMVRKFAVAGTIEECVDRVREYVDAGVTQFVCSAPIGENVEEAIRSLGREFSHLLE